MNRGALLGRPIATALSDEMIERLKAYANKEERTLAWIVRKALEEFLDRAARGNP